MIDLKEIKKLIAELKEWINESEDFMQNEFDENEYLISDKDLLNKLAELEEKYKNDK